MYKFHFIVDKTKKSKKLFKKLYNLKNYSISKSNVIIVAGGDGFMLRTLKKYYKYKIPFYGINCGTIGFLMNKFDNIDLNKKIKKAKSFNINPLMINIKNISGKNFKTLAINEISMLRQSRQTAILKLQINKSILIKKLISDGVLVSTPAGSTAYNLSVYGPILSLNSKKLAVTPISPFRPRRWRGKIFSENATIFIKNIGSKKRPVSAVADNYEMRNIKSVKIKANKKINIKILFNPNESLIKKIKFEQKKIK